MLDLKTCLFGLVLGAAALNVTPDHMKAVLAAILAVLMGLLVKLALEWDQNRLTVKRATTQTIFSSGIGYMAFYWLDGKAFMGMRPEVVLFLMSLVAAHLVTAINTVGKERSKSIVEELLDRVIARKNNHQHEDERVEAEAAERKHKTPA